MIAFSPSPDQRLILDTVRGFANHVLRPAARAADEAEALPDVLLSQAWELGIIAAQIPAAYGGSGVPRSPVTSALVLEALAHADPALALAITHSAAFALGVVEQGTEEQRNRYLPMFCGKQFAAASLALMEPTPLFEACNIATRAKSCDSGFVLTGTKCCVPLADRASHFLVLARNETAKLDAFIVPRAIDGLSIAPERNLGLRALPTSRLELRDVAVEASERLGGNAGFDAARLFATSHAASAALLLGLGCAVMDYVIPYAKERRAFGRYIAQKQAVAFMLANMRIETDALRWLTWKAASELEHGRPAGRAASAAHRYAAQHVMRIADDGLQVLGGHGYIREHPLELWYRAARTLSVLQGMASV